MEIDRLLDNSQAVGNVGGPVSGVECATREPINCDQVAWIDRSLERLLGAAISPTASHLRTQGAKAACILEIMDVLHLGFKDESAMENAVSDLQLKQRLILQPAR